MSQLKIGAPEIFETRKHDDLRRLQAVAVTITTPNKKYAGTDADVYFEIAGNNYLMDKPGYDDFERGDTDTYQFRCNLALGELRNAVIRLHHNNKGRNSGWYCGQVTLNVQYENTSYMCLYKRWSNVGWLAKDEGPYYTTEAILQEGKEV